MVHPLPPALPASFDTTGVTGPLADHIAYHHDLRTLALAERDELEGLRLLARGAPLCEVPLLDHDVHDVPALIELAALMTG